jgi:hypothetical protein
MGTAANQRDIDHFFEYSNSGVEVLEDGLKEVPFGEFLVEQRAVTRFQLLRALQMQDRHPDVRIGECVAALGYLQWGEVEDYLTSWNGLRTVELR